MTLYTSYTSVSLRPRSIWARARRGAQSALAGFVMAGVALGWWWPHPPYDVVHVSGAVVGLTIHLVMTRSRR